MTTCKTCQFYEKTLGANKTGQTGVCKQGPPVMEGMIRTDCQADRGVWPSVMEFETKCGKYKKKHSTRKGK